MAAEILIGRSEAYLYIYKYVYNTTTTKRKYAWVLAAFSFPNKNGSSFFSFVLRLETAISRRDDHLRYINVLFFPNHRNLPIIRFYKTCSKHRWLENKHISNINLQSEIVVTIVFCFRPNRARLLIWLDSRDWLGFTVFILYKAANQVTLIDSTASVNMAWPL